MKICGVATITMAVMKLCGVLDIPWLWIFCPVLVIAALIGALLVVTLMGVTGKLLMQRSVIKRVNEIRMTEKHLPPIKTYDEAFEYVQQLKREMGE